jgi:hypothetical protein
MKDDLPWMLDAAVRTGLRDFRRRELHIRAVRLRRRLLGAATRFWRFRDGRLTGFRAQRRTDHAARLLRRAARPGRILKLMADEGRQRFHKKTPPHLGCAEAGENMRGKFMQSFLRLFDCFLKKVNFLIKQTALSCRYRRKIQNRRGRKAVTQ